jgi:hypothetical protein
VKSLANPQHQRELAARIAALNPSDSARWGKMNVHQMICHATEAYRYVVGRRKAAMARSSVPRPLLKFAALHIPLPWPHGFPSPPEIAQDRHGTPPVAFDQDHAALLTAFHAFCAGLPDPLPPHPYFGAMSQWDWQRWGYLHMDHHLRQFGR